MPQYTNVRKPFRDFAIDNCSIIIIVDGVRCNIGYQEMTMTTLNANVTHAYKVTDGYVDICLFTLTHRTRIVSQRNADRYYVTHSLISEQERS